MKQLTFLLVLTAVLIYSGNIFSQNRLEKNKIAILDDGSPSSGINLVDRKNYQNIIFNADNNSAGTVIPFIQGYVDYVTNGNSLDQILVRGDTVIVGISRTDSIEAPAAAAGVTLRMYYNISYDRGVTWKSSDGYVLSVDRKSRFPDLSLVHTSNGYTVMGTGRGYFTPLTSTVRKPGLCVDILFGAGSPTAFLVNTANGYDLFSAKRSDGNIGGIFNSLDTLYYVTYTPLSNTLSPNSYVYNLPAPSSNFVASYMTAASQISNHMTIAYNYVNEAGPRSLRLQTSVNNGGTWTPPLAVLQSNYINGDSVSPYWHEDIEYKPGTNDPFAVFCTNDVFASYTSGVDLTRATKIIIYSPSLNGGSPVVVADRNNVPIMRDTNSYKKIVKLQVNSNPLSHPSVGFSTDGSVIYVAYAIAQTDTNTTGAVLGFNYFDIWAQRSDNGGMTWSTPKNITNTPLVDEMYPVVAPTGNSLTNAYITYMSNALPGSQSFNDLQTIVPTYQMIDYVAIPVGIKNISSTVPASYSLKQNFPNPFNPTTSIRFDISKSINVTLKVYNTVGKEVATLINNENVTPGIKEVTFDASDLSSGIYFYTLQAGDFKETKKMMLTK